MYLDERKFQSILFEDNAKILAWVGGIRIDNGKFVWTIQIGSPGRILKQKYPTRHMAVRDMLAAYGTSYNKIRVVNKV